MSDELVPVSPATFNAPALLGVVAAWAKQNTDPESSQHAMTVQVKTNIVMSCLDFCGKPPAAVTPQDILAYQAELEASHLKPATVYTYLQHVSSFYTWAMQVPGLQEVIKDNPVRLVRPKAPKPYSSEKTKALSDEQVAELVSVVQARADAALPPEPTDIDGHAAPRRQARSGDPAALPDHGHAPARDHPVALGPDRAAQDRRSRPAHPGQGRQTPRADRRGPGRRRSAARLSPRERAPGADEGELATLDPARPRRQGQRHPAGDTGAGDDLARLL